MLDWWWGQVTYRGVQRAPPNHAAWQAFKGKQRQAITSKPLQMWLLGTWGSRHDGAFHRIDS